ncbi:uncharacterized protein LOC117135057 [Drosophila busckii]|uniref:uncharacterized protein LOC117135057 n=1 Tax=Drosophila busckii TaxID=30019 RepID=UPI001432DEF1|nr:uncharacterized protein LOC117135057 [Drosophila busckii]
MDDFSMRVQCCTRLLKAFRRFRRPATAKQISSRLAKLLDMDERLMTKLVRDLLSEAVAKGALGLHVDSNTQRYYCPGIERANKQLVREFLQCRATMPSLQRLEQALFLKGFY